MEKLVILGSGIAGCTAAIYAARANLSPLVIAGPEEGGQLTLTTEVENFPGFPEGIQGPELVKKAKEQAVRFGTRFKTEMAVKFTVKDRHYELELSNEEIIRTRALIIATGASARWLEIPSEKKYKGRGVTTCATCDGYFFRNKEVVVVGGGDSAMEEALFLSKICSKVTIVYRGDKLRASKIMQERALKNEKIKIIYDSVIEEVFGDEKKVTKVKLKNIKKNEEKEYPTSAVFLAIGHIPNTKIFQGTLELDEKGYLKATPQMHTNLPGVFAAGDVQDTHFRQAITAAGSGCIAAMEAERYLAGLG